MGRACEAMLSSVSHYKLRSTRMDKLYQQFSVGDGLTLYKSCDTALGLKAHKLYMERNLFAQLSTTESVPHQSQAVDRKRILCGTLQDM